MNITDCNTRSIKRNATVSERRRSEGRTRFRTKHVLFDRQSFGFIWPVNSPRPFVLDKQFVLPAAEVHWLYLPKRQRARGLLRRAKTRQYLHRYVLALAKKFYPEVSFASGDPFDCRLVNLKPYRREEDGARRIMFRTNSSGFKGVSFHKPSGKWAAMIRSRSRLHHLGLFKSPDAAAAAYGAAYDLIHAKA